MKNTNWTTIDEMKQILTPVNLKSGVEKSGIPIMYDKEYLYIDEKENHTLVIGSTGSGKTQSTILPITKLAMMASESLVINDVKGDLYERTAIELEKRGYKVYAIDLEKPNYGNSWNPLTLPYQTFKLGNRDKALEMISDLGYYLFKDIESNNSDLFWINAATDYFTGLTQYLFENAQEEEINIGSIYSLSDSIKNDKEFLKKINKISSIYLNLAVTLESPSETKDSIIAVFNQKIKNYICFENLSNMMSFSDFNMADITKNKMAIFIISGNSSFGNNLIPLFVNQIINCVDEVKENKKRINILLDEFDTMLPIKNFAKLINYSRSLKIRFTVVIKSYRDLINVYGKENTEIIKMCFSNRIYLLSNDIYTIEEISELCGKHLINNNVEPLISVEELKTLKHFEAIVLMMRIMPFKTKLLPDYEIDWGYETELKIIPERKKNQVKTFEK